MASKTNPTSSSTAVAEKKTSKTALAPPVTTEQLAKADKMLTEAGKNGTLPLSGSGITRADVEGKIKDIDSQIIAFEGQIAELRAQQTFHKQVMSTYWG